MKITLINPYISISERYAGKTDSGGGHQAPLGICYIAQVLKNQFYDVNIIDAEAESLDEAQVLERIKDSEIIGITSTTVGFHRALHLAKTIKEKASFKIIVLGGPHVSCVMGEVLKYDCFDYAVYGEGEYTMLELCNCFRRADGARYSMNFSEHNNEDISEIKGLIYRHDNKIVVNPTRDYERDLDKLPMPAIDLLPDIELYNPPPMNYMKKPVVNIITSRGCPNQCIEENQKIMFSRKKNNKIKNVSIGDWVMAIDEKINKLVETEVINKEIIEKEVYEIELENGYKIEASNDHPFYTQRGWIELKDLKVTDKILSISPNEKVSFNKKVCNPMFFQSNIDKMNKTNIEKGNIEKARKRMKKLHKNGIIPYNTEKQKLGRKQSKNAREKNGMYKENCDARKYDNFNLFKKLIERKIFCICEKCYSNEFLLVHHKDGSHENDKVSNLQILCKSCHAKVHNIIENMPNRPRKNGIHKN